MLESGENSWRTVCNWARVPNKDINSFGRTISTYRTALRKATTKAEQNAIISKFNKNYRIWYAPHAERCERIKKELNNLISERRRSRALGSAAARRLSGLPRSRAALEAQKAHMEKMRNHYAAMVANVNALIKKLNQRS
jgi:hypothetical protein